MATRTAMRGREGGSRRQKLSPQLCACLTRTKNRNPDRGDLLGQVPTKKCQIRRPVEPKELCKSQHSKAVKTSSHPIKRFFRVQIEFVIGGTDRSGSICRGCAQHGCAGGCSLP